MRIAHKVRPPRNPKPVEIDSEYQAQVDRSTEKLEQAYLKAQRAVQAAERRLERARELRQQRERAKAVREAEATLAQRLEELAEYERMMTSTPASLKHRGRGGWKKVPR